MERFKDLFDLVRKAYNDEFCFGMVETEKIGRNRKIGLITLNDFAMEVGKELGE